MKFYNPYQFIPLAKPDKLYKYDEIQQGNEEFIRHDRWEDDALSGHITCKLTTLSPLVIGARQEEGDKKTNTPGRVIPYRDGQYLPANSLRGMIASVAEAISQSALRVLSKREAHEYAVRKEMRDSLKAIGLLRKDEEGWYITPLALSALRLENGRLPRKWQKVFSSLKLKECLAHYVGHYPDGDAPYTQELNNGSITTYQHDKNKRKMQFPKGSCLPDEVLVDSTLTDQCCLKVHKGTLKPRQLTQEGSETKGVFYVLGGKGQASGMPRKIHDLFIPWPDDLDGRKRLSVDEGCVQAFNSLLVNRHQDSKQQVPFPFMPVGYEGRFRGENPQVVRSGDLVYFDVDNAGEEVTELSYSAIWRKPVGNLYGSLKKIDKNLLPWHLGRSHLTPAEALFGVVEDGKAENRGARNLASRLRFHDAEADEYIELMSEIPLKILASPKPPSPSMYFRKDNGGYIAKKNLDLNNEEHVPNGRKRYLPHPAWQNQSEDGKAYWETRNDDNKHQKLRVCPVQARESFTFHIDFENLSPAEYTLLRTAVAPGKNFQHQLGLGKPLGLGQVKISINSEQFIDRNKRYTVEQLNKDRFGGIKPQKDDEALIAKDALNQLLTLGNPSSLMKEANKRVCYPFHKSQEACGEEKGYLWFVENDGSANHQFLEAVEAQKELPPLDSDTDNWMSAERQDVSLSSVTLKLSGLRPINQRPYDEEDIINAITAKWPGTKVIKINLDHGGKIEMETVAGFDIPEHSRFFLEFEVNGDTLKFTKPR